MAYRIATLIHFYKITVERTIGSDALLTKVLTEFVPFPPLRRLCSTDLPPTKDHGPRLRSFLRNAPLSRPKPPPLHPSSFHHPALLFRTNLPSSPAPSRRPLCPNPPP